MSLATLIRRMSDAGAPPEAIALAVEEIEALQVSLEARRASDRERKREQRERQKSANVTGQSEDIPETVTPDPSPSEVSPQTPLPNSPNQGSPLSPPMILEERRAALASCLHQAFPPPEGVTGEQWAAFCKQRRKKLNERSYLLLTNKLTKLVEAGWPAGEMIDRAVESGWETVFAPSAKGQVGTSRRYVSASGYEYRGDLEAVQREAKRRNDMDTYWQVEVDRKSMARAA